MWEIPRQTIGDIINNAEKRHLSDFAKDFKPYLKAENTQEKIAELMGITRKQIGNIIDGNIGQMSQITKDFKPYLYNIWNTPKQDNERKQTAV